MALRAPSPPTLTNRELTRLRLDVWREFRTTTEQYRDLPPIVRERMHVLLDMVSAPGPIDVMARHREADDRARNVTKADRKRHARFGNLQRLAQSLRISRRPVCRAVGRIVNETDPSRSDLAFVEPLAHALGIPMKPPRARGCPSGGSYEATDLLLMPAMKRLMTAREPDFDGAKMILPPPRRLNLKEAATALEPYAFGQPGNNKRLRLEGCFRKLRSQQSADAAQVVDHEAAEFVV